MFSLVAHEGRKSQHDQAVHIYIYRITFDVQDDDVSIDTITKLKQSAVQFFLLSKDRQLFLLMILYLFGVA